MNIKHTVLSDLLFIPLSGLYTLGVAFRHLLYDRRVLLSHSVSLPTICVGNLAVGGTGKTPMVEYIVKLLQTNGFHPAILSRGYKRKTRGFVLADANSTAQTIGDEAMQMHRKYPDIPVAVCEHRVRGVQQLERQIENLDVVILDDAFQHRGIRCGFSVLLTPYDNLYIDDHMLPWGTLRDLPSRAIKADAVVVTKCPSNMKPIDMRVVDNRLHLPTFQLLHFAGLEHPMMEQSGNPLVLCGIAQPKYMMESVQQYYPKAELMAFPDHHNYTEQDIDTIMERAEKFDFVLTTEKDMQRLRLTSLFDRLAAKNKRLIAQPVQMHFLTDHVAFDRQILTYVRENCRQGKQ